MGTHPIFESDFDCLTELEWRLLHLGTACCAMEPRHSVSPTEVTPSTSFPSFAPPSERKKLRSPRLSSRRLMPTLLPATLSSKRTATCLAPNCRTRQTWVSTTRLTIFSWPWMVPTSCTPPSKNCGRRTRERPPSATTCTTAERKLTPDQRPTSECWPPRSRDVAVHRSTTKY